MWRDKQLLEEPFSCYGPDCETSNTFRNLRQLLEQWKEFIEEQQQSGDRACLLLLGSFAVKVNEFGLDWFFLEMLWASIFFSDAYKFHQSEQLISKILDVADEIYGLLSSRDDPLPYGLMNRSQEVLSLLSDCRRKTDELIMEIDIPQLLKGMSVQLDVICNYLANIELCYLHHGPIYDTRLEDATFGDASSVIVCISVRYCIFWFNRQHPETASAEANKITNLLKKVAPTNPEFLQSNLRFLKSFSSEQNEVTHFCRYLLNCHLGNQQVIENEQISPLRDLVTVYFEKTLEDGEEDEDIFIAEMTAVLAEVAFFSLANVQRYLAAKRAQNRSTVLPPELQAKLFLLKEELFLKQLLKICNSSMPNDKFFKADMILTYLRTFSDDLSQLRNTEFLKQSLVFVEKLPNDIETLYKSLHVKRITIPLVKHSLQQWLFRIAILKAESCLAEILKSNDTSLAHKMDQIQSLFVDLQYFKEIVITKLASNPSDDETVFVQIEVIARGITLLSYSYLPDNEKFEKIIHSLPQLLDKVCNVKPKLREISQQFPRSIFPKTFQPGFYDFLCRNIREFLKHDFESITSVKNHFEEVLLHLESLKVFLLKVKDADVEHGDLKELIDHIMHAAYKLEYVVDSIEVDGHLQQSKWLYDVMEEVKRVDQHVQNIPDMSYAGKEETNPQIQSQIVPIDTIQESREMLVNLVDEENIIIDRLARGSVQRDVVSIVGMPGIGKTTLARKLYNKPNVMCHFRRRAWCTVSQTYMKRELLLELLACVDMLTDDINKLSDDDLMSKLRRCLLRNKYLIVMDDIWDTAAWKDLEKCFPDDGNGSRILITSRCQNVASEIKPDCDPHPIRPFTDVESWTLLKDKIFKGADCPTELLEVGMEIAQQCQGLPLAIVAVAGLLKMLEKKKDSWTKVLKSLSTEIISNPENRCKEILELSFKNLPEYLKACFIYLGVFLQDKDIPVTKLMNFWMAEGFIQQTELKSLEEVAESYLMELINRSLVNIHKARSNGKVKTCRLHDLLCDMCLLKAKEANFQRLVTEFDEPYASFPDSKYDMEYDGENVIAPTIFDSYRLSFCVKRPHFIHSRPSGLVTRSLTFYASSDSEPKCPYDISFICHNFKLLRILDLESIMLISFPVEMGLMIQLRYLAVSGYMESIPSSISKLWKLETLVVKGLRKVVLPETIWSMVRLRHLHVNNHVIFSLQGLDENVVSSSQLENLVSFSTPSLSCRNDRWRILKRLSNLRKLRCIFWQSGDSSEIKHELIRWNILTLLESLKIICYGGSPNSRDFVLPQNLKKLTLTEFCLQENHLSVIGELPNLRVLKFRAGTFEGQKWEMREEEFKELNFLELDRMNLVEWNASCDHLPSLEQLVIRNCKNLSRIPSDFAYTATLKKVEVHWCSESVEASAEEIGAETQEIKIVISRV